jgi:hypothetical protein
MQLFLRDYEGKVADLESRVDRAAEEENYELAEEL